MIGGVNLIIKITVSRLNPAGSSYRMPTKVLKPYASGTVASLSMLSRLFFKILSVQNIPFPAPRWHVTGKRLDFLPNHSIDMVVAVKEFMDDLLRLGQRAALVRKTCEVVLFDSVEN